MIIAEKKIWKIVRRKKMTIIADADFEKETYPRFREFEREDLTKKYKKFIDKLYQLM